MQYFKQQKNNLCAKKQLIIWIDEYEWIDKLHIALTDTVVNETTNVKSN